MGNKGRSTRPQPPAAREPSVAWRGLKRYAARYVRPPVDAMVTVPAADEAGQEWTRRLAALLSGIGVDLVRAGTRTTDVEAEIRDIAARYGMRARSFVVPTGLFVRVGDGPDGIGGELDFAPVEGPDLRLDQVEALLELTSRMRAAPVPFSEALRALEQLRQMPERFSPAAVVSGYALLTIGLGVILHATWAAAIGYAVLGAAVGLLRLVTARWFPGAATVLPVAAAILVTALSLRFAGPLLHESPGRLFIPPLIAFLPGAALTMGAIELAVGDVLSGVARLAGAGNVLLLLALGILVGTETVSSHAAEPPLPQPLGVWAGWCGVLLLAAGFMLYYSAPVRTLGWLMGALLAERLVQQVGAQFAGAAFGAFAAGMLLPPMAAWVQRHHHIPDQVVFLPCFWMLVPGSSGLSGVSELLVQHNASSLAALASTLVTVTAVALGVLVGAGLQRRTHLRVASAVERRLDERGGGEQRNGERRGGEQRNGERRGGNPSDARRADQGRAGEVAAEET